MKHPFEVALKARKKDLEKAELKIQLLYLKIDAYTIAKKAKYDEQDSERIAEENYDFIYIDFEQKGADVINAFEKNYLEQRKVRKRLEKLR
jgi:hypothetical protein